MRSGSRLLQPKSADRLQLHETGKARVNADDCFAALERTYARVDGGFACVAFIAGFGLIAFRDSYGIRPLILGSRNIGEQETDYMIASESVALKFFGSTPKEMRDILPGQAVIIEKGKEPRFHQAAARRNYAPDAFEMVYFARPDSVIDGISVSRARRNMGVKLAKTIARQLKQKGVDAIDVVIAIPETSTTAAKLVAKELNKELVDGFTKNRYVFRTFIMSDQRLRRTGVRRKLNAHDSEFEGRNVLVSLFSSDLVLVTFKENADLRSGLFNAIMSCLPLHSPFPPTILPNPVFR